MTANEYLSKFKLFNTVIKQLEQERQSLVAFVNGEYPQTQRPCTIFVERC